MIKSKLAYFTQLPFLIQTALAIQWAIYSVIALFYLYLSLPNPLYDSNNSVFHGSYVHPISWVFVMLFAIYVRYKIPVFHTGQLRNIIKGGTKETYMRFAYNFLITILLVAFAMAITEISWDISMTYWWYVHNEMTGITLTNFVLTYAYIMLGLTIIASIFAGLQTKFRNPWLIPLVFAVFQIMWLSQGFHISTLPQYAHDLTANVFELTHWGLLPVLFGVLLK